MSNDSILPLWWIIFVFLVVRWAIKISYFVQTWKFSKFRNSFLIIFLSFHGYIKLKKTLNFKLPQTSWFTFAVWKVSKYKVFSGLYLPVFSPNPGKYGLEKTLYLDTFHSVIFLMAAKILTWRSEWLILIVKSFKLGFSPENCQ